MPETAKPIAGPIFSDYGYAEPASGFSGEKKNVAEDARKKRQEEEEARKKRQAERDHLAKIIGLDPAIRLIGCLYINRSAYERLSSSFESVVLPSLFTKVFGRLAIITGLISHASIAAFILTNLVYAAPEVALLAAAIRFAYVLIKDLKSGKPLEEALKNAAKEALKTAIKFFIVYMVWTLAIALATKLAILSGPLLPVGIILVGVLTSLGFTLASFIVDKLPELLAEPKKSWTKFTEKLHELKACILPGLMEGTSWTLMDNAIVNISAHIVRVVGGFAGQVLDAAVVSLVVSAFFFIGAVIHSSVSRWLALRGKPQEIKDPEVVRSVEKRVGQIAEVSDMQGPEKGLPSLFKELNKKGYNDPRLKNAIIEYLQWCVVLAALNKLVVEANQSSNNSDKQVRRLSVHHKAWAEHLPQISSECSLLNRVTETPRGVLREVEKISRKIQESKNPPTTRAAEKMHPEIKARLEASHKKLQRFGLFKEDPTRGSGLTPTTTKQQPAFAH